MQRFPKLCRIGGIGLKPIYTPAIYNGAAALFYCDLLLLLFVNLNGIPRMSETFADFICLLVFFICTIVSSWCEMSPWPLTLLLWLGPAGWEAFPPLLYLSRTTGSLLWRVVFGVSSRCPSGTGDTPVLGAREETRGKMEPEKAGVYQRSEGTCRS